ncbi:MAG TPA: PIG-L family deacetylase [Vicinamibacterales bacterium]|nr:PIG-L family deacetylase [Vicinamibacterales bacterium]
MLTVLHAYAPLPQDRGAAGTWQKIQKLRTIASLMHVTAHPDDEHGGMLALESRDEGARVSLLTLNRGEAGDNAIGPELFDALGLIRTEELLRADQYYGVDQQYFTTVVDYGFSKRLEEALQKWGRENVLRDAVRIVRLERPLVIVSRFQGNERDGHGNHQAAGLIAQEAYRVAGDANAFPEQIRDEGLRPWQPLKLYMGGVRESEDWTLRVDTNVYSPWLGDTYATFARLGLAYQRSQNSGRVDGVPAPRYLYYKRLASRVDAPAKEQSFFDGIDIRPAWYAPIATHVDEAIRAFTMADPSASAPALARGLTAVRDAMTASAADRDRSDRLARKEQQFADALTAALGIEFSAVAQTDRPLVAGETIDVHVHSAAHASVAVESVGSDTVQKLTAPAAMSPTRPYFTRSSIADARYRIVNAEFNGRPSAPPPFVMRLQYRVDGVPVRLETPVVFREPQPPYGTATRELTLVPSLAVNVSPHQAIVPLGARDRRLRIGVETVNNAPAGSTGTVALTLPAGWTSEPASASFALARAGETSRFEFLVTPTGVAARDYSIDVVAKVGSETFAEGYDVIAHRDLETRYLYHAATTEVRGVDVKIATGLKVGYVMGVGDDVPSGLAQLGIDVHLLSAADLATADLSGFDAIMTGTRAYGVRDDLRTYNRRLLDYVKGGGNLIVLYNTPQEFDPKQFAPYPATLPRDAEEVSEEDAPVTILAPTRREFTTPNAITTADFDGWVEQRGSKFWSDWDAAYTPMVETHDQGQAPQRGGWLAATYGKGRYTYFAYAFHRQLPYGVPGAYRILANLVSK